MIVQTKKQTHIVQKQVYYKPINNENIGVANLPVSQAYSHRQPILGLGQNNQKRLLEYNIRVNNEGDYKNNNNQENWETHSDMSRSRLSKINQELEQRTNYYTKYGKYDSKWAESHVQNFGNTESRIKDINKRQLSVRSSGEQNRSYGNHNRSYGRVQNQYQPRQQYQFLTTNYRQTQPIYINSKQIHPSSISPEPQQSYSSQQQSFSPQQQQSYTSPNSPQPYMVSNQQYPMSPLTHQQPTFNHRTSQYSNLSEQDEHKFYDLEDPKDALRYQAHQLKEVTKDQAREVKDQVKANVRQNVQGVVGTENYYLLKDVKDNVGQLADNALVGVKQNVQVVTDTAKAAKDVVVGGAREAKDQVKENTKQVVKGAVGEQNFNLMKYIKDATGQITKSLFGVNSSADPNAKKVEQNKVVPAEMPVRSAASNNVGSSAYMKSASLNQVSPIQYSQRSFSQAPTDQFGFFWIYGLIAVGFFLVLFQALK